MEKIGIPSDFGKRIIKLYSNRKLQLQINNELLDPRISNVGLPQGSILSPLLYLIYTSDLHKKVNTRGNVLQFADDVCIYVPKVEIDQGINIMSKMFSTIEEYYFNIGLSISTKKTQACIFSKKHRLPQSIVFNNVNFEVQASINYLGMVIDRKLLWNEHIDRLITKTEKGLNAIRSVCHTSWGADPNVTLTFYKAYIRSIIDYGSIFYSQAAKTHLKKLDRLVNKVLRISIGALKSTPISNLNVECNEPPLNFRRDYLTEKFLLKMYAKKSPVVQKCFELSIYDLVKEYWQKKPTIPIIESYKYVRIQLSKDISTSRELPCFKIELEHLDSIKVGYLRNYSEFPQYIRNSMFQADIKSMFPNYSYIFSDAFKSDLKVTSAFYDPDRKFSTVVDLNIKTSIYTAELIAILEALKYISNFSRSKSNYVIFSDNKSSIQKIENISKYNNIGFNYVLSEIINLVGTIKLRGSNVMFCWIKAHCGISNNVIVDKIAKYNEPSKESEYKCGREYAKRGQFLL
ncbi:uncharacterized protein [Diabrotica undecimpunctata]|uniref:uncharacterized protein n=1 Tax=Diabrotica undecimpunctata TaxID=50387 RepID=UPI003B636E9E